MKPAIGNNYISNLMKINHYLKSISNGIMQEKTEFVIEENQGTCYYDKCPEKDEPSKQQVKFYHKDGSTESYSFHAVCLDSLHLDERLASLN